MKTVVVIGGGITGLTMMYELQKLKKNAQLDLHLTLVEENASLGGKISTVHNGEFIMETGADSIVARKKGVSELLEELQLQNDVVYNDVGKSYLYQQQQLKPIPEDTVFGIPTSIESLFRSELVSTKGKVVALKDLITKNATFTKDSSVGEFLEQFFGKELVQYQIAPVLSGVYSGKLHELTLATTLPFLVDYKNEYGSIIRGFHHHRQQFLSADRKKFISFRNGLSTLIDRLEETLIDATILKNTRALKIERQHKGYTISLSNDRHITADYIVLATPHTVAQSLLNNPSLDAEFNQLKTASLISVYLGFDLPDSILPSDGTGFIVPENSDLVCNACTWTSRKWSHTSERKQLLLRLFYKNSDPKVYDMLNHLSKEELVKIALKDVEKSLHITGQPVTAEVTKWHQKMPKYDLNHRKTIDSLNQKLKASDPNVLLAGCSYYGVGLADCMLNGKHIAEQIIDLVKKI
ncbi:protoporphyrinogen oxidase [Heyndrickxia ginsengihumi]|uniref:protoporphyrinogen oxidase n=1 Tax=Heyndrickxia ginsengihumi TaxID=363870 RepID=UPI0004729FB8|nr:protoporphyrinogen oxidase [Heyndrickxia ginsengihumi]